MAGGKGADNPEPIYKPKFTGALENFLTASALGGMVKNNPNMARLLNGGEGHDVLQGLGIGGTGQQGGGNPLQQYVGTRAGPMIGGGNPVMPYDPNNPMRR